MSAAWRLAKSTAMEVVSSVPRSFGLALLWMAPPLFAVVGLLLFAEQVPGARQTYTIASAWARIAALLGACVVSLDLIAGERASGLLTERLMWPLSRSQYYIVRVLSRGFLATAGASISATAVWLTATLLMRSLVAERGDIIGPTATMYLFSAPIAAVCAVSALAALATISSGRYGHLVYWLAFLVLASLQGMGVGGPRWLIADLAAGFCRWILGPAVRGPDLTTTGLSVTSIGHGMLFVLEALYGLFLTLVVGVWRFAAADYSPRG